MSADPEIPLSVQPRDPEEAPKENTIDARLTDAPLTDTQSPPLVVSATVVGATVVSPGSRRIPNLGHAAIFGLLILVGILVLVITIGLLLGVALGLHWISKGSFDRIFRDPLFDIPVMAFGYIMIAALCFPVFGLLWKRPFTNGVQLNYRTARMHLWRLLATGIGIGLVVQWLSNYLPIPKSLPIDDFFKSTSSVWMVAIFGVFIAPAFEELAFRGFLLPALANTWDWLTRKVQRPPYFEKAPADNPPRWSAPATILATILTSIAFMFIHADQLAHAWAPLAVLFTVSVLLCVVRIVTGSLAASIFVHASYNFSIFATLFLATNGFRHLEKIQS